jgi:hypothetical protein
MCLTAKQQDHWRPDAMKMIDNCLIFRRHLAKINPQTYKMQQCGMHSFICKYRAIHQYAWRTPIRIKIQ